VVGKRLGRIRWSPTTPKTLEGSAAFVLSVVGSAWLLRVVGAAEPFSVSGFRSISRVVAISGVFLPFFRWRLRPLASRFLLAVFGF
jgi:dolichol kinase